MLAEMMEVIIYIIKMVNLFAILLVLISQTENLFMNLVIKYAKMQILVVVIIMKKMV